jgi:thiamine phosphate synthase YjbQ (UPF0047 family)
VRLTNISSLDLNINDFSMQYESGVINDLKKAIEKIVPSNIPYEHDLGFLFRRHSSLLI